ncbi:ATP-dependent DNA helicase PIF1-like protein [Tanacetum coccineum]
MQEVQLIIWDEAPMTQRYAFEALDTTLQDILGFTDSEKRRQIFRGMTVLLGGDFRQILPVIPQAKRLEIVQACINRYELWRYYKVFTLTRSMRVNEYSANGADDKAKQEFNHWVLAVGDGTLPAKMKEGEDEPTWIDIPKKFLIKTWDCPIQKIIEETYLDFTSRQTNDEYLKERAILTPRNDDADAINEFMFKQLSGKYVTYNSADEESVNPSQGLCNGTRLIITDVGQFVIHAKILTGSHIGDEVVW